MDKRTHQVGRVKYLELSDGGVSGVREVTPGAPVRRGGDGEGAQPRPVRGRLVDDVHAGHVANVVDVQRLLEADDQNLRRNSWSSSSVLNRMYLDSGGLSVIEIRRPSVTHI